MTYVEEYVKRLNAIRASQMFPMAGSIPPTVSNAAFANLILQNARSNFNLAGPPQKPQNKSILKRGKNLAMFLMDVLSRPNYAVAEATKEGITGEGNPLAGAWKGLKGEKKTSFINTMQAANEKQLRGSEIYKQLQVQDSNAAEAYVQDELKKNRAQNAMIGLVGDIALDPLNLVGAGVISKAGKAAKGGKFLEALRGAGKAAVAETPASLESQVVPEALKAAKVAEKITPTTEEAVKEARYATPADVFNRDLRPKDYEGLQKARNLAATTQVVDQFAKGNPAAVDLLTYKLLTPLGPVARRFTDNAVADTIKEIRVPKKAPLAYNAIAQGNLSNKLLNQIKRVYKEDSPELFDQYKNMLKNAEEGLIEHGRVKRSDKFNPRGGTKFDSPYLRLSDVLDALPSEIARKAILGAEKVQPVTLLKAVTGDSRALNSLSKHPDIFDAIHEIDWTPLMVKEHATRVIESSTRAHKAANTAAGFIAAKLGDNSSAVNKSAVVGEITKAAKAEFKNEAPEVKRTIGDMLDGLRKTMPNPLPNPVNEILERHKLKLEAGVFGGKNGEHVAQAPRIAVSAEATASVLKTETGATGTATQIVKKAGEDFEAASIAAESGIFTTVMSWFNPALGYKDLRPFVLKNVGARRASATIRAHNFTKIFNSIPEDEQLAFWTEVRGYLPPTPGRTQAVSDMQKVIHNLFGESGLEGKFANNTAISRSGVNVRHLNKHLRIIGIKDFKFETKVKDPATGGMLELEPHKVLSTWKYYQPKTPKDLRVFVSNLTQAAENAMVEYSSFAQLGAMYGSKTARNGYIKVSGMHPAIEGMYFPKDIAPQIGKMSLGIDQFTESLGSGKVMHFYDQMLRTWKSSVTIYLLSHHIRNVIGDSWLAWMDGMNDPTYFAKSFDVIKTQRWRYSDIKEGKNPLKDILGEGRESEIIGEMMGVAAGRIPRPEHVAVMAKVGKKKYPMTREQVYQMGFRQGIFPHSSVIEDLPGSETFMEQLANKYHPGKVGPFAPFKGNVSKGARGTSEVREHFVRIAHWMYALEHPDKPVNSLEELMVQASSRVRRYHPDGLDLTAVERKVFRRLIPFYSWQRKSIPLIMEGLVTHPAKIMAYPKVMHAVQESQGIDTSISEPWPTDQLFPDWLSGSVIGPTLPPTNAFAKLIARSDAEVGYTLINPGTPATDLFKDIFNSPVKGIANQLTPAIKIPAELTFGQELYSGAKIDDYSEYADKNLPPVAPLSRMTQGLLGTGLLEGGDLRGKETKPVNYPAIINFLIAAGILDTGRYTKGGEFDLKARIAAQRKKQYGSQG